MKIRKYKLSKIRYKLRLIDMRLNEIKTYNEKEWEVLMNTKSNFDHLIDRKRRKKRRRKWTELKR